MIFTNDLFVTAAGVGGREQQSERIQLFVLLDVRLAQNLQEKENTSVLQKLAQVMITEGSEKWHSVNKRRFGDNACRSVLLTEPQSRGKFQLL